MPASKRKRVWYARRPCPERLASNERSRLLVPFVSNQAGFDTGIAVSNTGGGATGAKAGRCTVSYYRAGSSIPAQTTNADVPVGDQLTFTLSGGGNFGITATPGFQGHLEIGCDFPFAHGFAYLSGVGSPYDGTSIPVLVLGATRNSAIIEGAGQ